MPIPIAAASLGFKLLGLFKKYWLHLLFALVIGYAVWHYMDLRGDLKDARHLAEQRLVQIQQQNEAIRRLNSEKARIERDINQLTQDNAHRREELEQELRGVRNRITQLLGRPPAATPEARCREATEELRNVDEILDAWRN
jgi:DNA repair exonuclease SbcCD ATPase subunit